MGAWIWCCLIGSACLSGCTSVKYYPLCVFGPDPKIKSRQELFNRTEKFVRTIVGEDAQIEIAPNQRVVVVKTDELHHEELAKVWPTAGCVGQTRYDVEYKQYKSCVYLIEKALSREGVPLPGKWSDALGSSTVYCGQSLGDASSKTDVLMPTPRLAEVTRGALPSPAARADGLPSTLSFDTDSAKPTAAEPSR